jgi:tetratricopeptide (TPR) repeat protein
METILAQKAVKFAVSGQWTEALATNLEILVSYPKDINTLNRLARCYSELGQISKAKETAKKVLSIDPTNQIALKCISKYNNIKNGSKRISEINSPEAFLEDPGKTKVVELLNLGDKKIISCLDTGDSLKITCHPHKVSITQNDKYIGRLPDDLSVRMRNCIKSGNTYSVLIKSARPDSVTIFIRELSNKTKSPSFPIEKINYISYTLPTQNLDANF